jgi:hypothetical protein
MTVGEFASGRSVRVAAVPQARSRSPLEVVAVTIVRVGTNKKYSEGWDSAFGKAAVKKKSAAASPKKAAKKKPAPSSAKKKPAKGKKR